jgi:membrane protein
VFGIVRTVLRDIKNIFARFFHFKCFYLAASISFYILLSMIPVLLLLISLFGSVLGASDVLHQGILEAIQKGIPNLSPTFTENLDNIVAKKRFTATFSFIILLLAANLFYDSIQYAFNIIFKIPRSRRFLHSRLFAFSFIVLVGLAIISNVLIGAYVKLAASNELAASYPALKNVLIDRIFLRFLPSVILIAFFTITLKVLPRTKVRFRFSLAGALLFSILWEGAKKIFTWYVIQFGSLNVQNIYGSLGTFVLFNLWIYYSMIILLFSAVVVAYLQETYGKRVRDIFLSF